MSEWQPIEIAPIDHENGTRILTWDGSRIYLTKRGFTAQLRRAGWFCTESGWQIHPTHWMPLPDPPQPDRDPDHLNPAEGGNKASD